MTLIEIGHWATVEIAPADELDPKRLVITDESLNSISLNMSAARTLVTAMQTLRDNGFLGDEQ